MNNPATPPRRASDDASTLPGFGGWQAGELIAGRWFVHRALPPTNMSIIYFCLDTASGQPMVVKTLPPRYLADGAARKRFTTECETWIRLGEHRNIVTSYFVEIVGSYPHVFVEWVCGKDIYHAGLDTWIGTPALSLQRAIDIMAQVCDGMSHATAVMAAAGETLVHRDIKPSNILITADWDAKITDFGIARTRWLAGSAADAAGLRGMPEAEAAQLGGVAMVSDTEFLGSPPYMSPEHFLNPASVDARSDIYSLGCSFFEVVTGHLVFRADSWNALRDAHVNRPAPRLQDYDPNIPPDIDGLVSSCLAKDRAARPQSFAEVKERLLGRRAPDGANARLGRVFGRLFGGRERSISVAASPPIPADQTGKGIPPLVSDSPQMAAPVDERAFEKFSDLLNQGTSLDAVGKPGEALVCYTRAEQALAEASASNNKTAAEFGLAINRAIAYEHLGDYPTSLAQWDRAIAASERLPMGYRGEHTPLAADTARPILGKAVTLSLSEDHEQAIRLCRAVITREPGNREVPSKIGYVLYRAEKFEEAVMWCQKAVELDPGDMYSLSNLGGALHAVGRIKEARQAIEGALRLAPTHAPALYQMGTLLLKNGSPEQAIDYLQKAVAIEPNDSDSWNHLGIALLQAGKPGYRECFEKAVRANPKHKAALGNLAMCIRREKASSTKQAIDSALAETGFRESAARTVRELFTTGRYAEAISAANSILAKDPENSEVLLMKATSLDSLGRTQEALQILVALVNRKPDAFTGLAYHNLGAMAGKLGDLPKSVEYYRCAVESGIGRAETWYGLALSLYQVDPVTHAQEALRCVAQAIQFKPNLAQAHDLRAHILFDLVRDAEALDSYDRYLALAPGQPAQMYNRAIVLLRLNRFLDAANAFGEVYQRDPSCEEAAANQVLTLAMAGREREARVVLNRALQAHPRSTPLLMADAQLRTNKV
jgi:tetratricopeptide (TPR) repeat protein/serine/threonine protein kinase